MQPIGISFATRYRTAKIFSHRPPAPKAIRLNHPVLMHWLGPAGLEVWSALLELGGNATVRELVTHTSLSDYRVRRTLRQFWAAGVVRASGQGQKVYQLNKDAETIILLYEQACDEPALQASIQS